MIMDPEDDLTMDPEDDLILSKMKINGINIHTRLSTLKKLELLTTLS